MTAKLKTLVYFRHFFRRLSFSICFDMQVDSGQLYHLLNSLVQLSTENSKSCGTFDRQM